MRALKILAFALGFIVSSVLQAAPQRPNVIVILCDDLGYGDLGIHGHPHIQTPNLDALASSGIRFANFYSTAPVCSPSRVGLMTGRSPNLAGVYDWIPPAGRPRPDARDQVHMRSDEITMPQLLKAAGYATCMAGKWHCNSHFNDASQPQPGDVGFDHWFATQNNAAPSHANPKNYVRNGQAVGPLKGFSCQIVADEAMGWIGQQQQADSDQPFFVYMAFHEPHEPVASPEKLVEQYLAVTDNRDQAEYFANVHNVDLAVGRVVKYLEQQKLRDNTLVVFTSDNGPETLMRYRSANRSWGVTGPHRGMKLHTHDGGIHVAGLLSWPGTVKGGQVIRQPVSALDLLPTMVDLAGASLPENRTFDGVSLATLLTMGQFPNRTKPLIWAYYNAINEAKVAMRFGSWKVLARLNGGQFPQLQNLTPKTKQQLEQATLTDFEIYNVDIDPGETQNLYGRDQQSSKKQDELLQQLKLGYAELLTNSPVWTPESE
ncbi:MAG: sulfatase-like hydrolase/transferase [Fuerstiella sp.]